MLNIKECSLEEAFAWIVSRPEGLASTEAIRRLQRFVIPRQQANVLRVAYNQIRSPLFLLLVVSAGLAWILGNATDSIVLFCVILMTVVLGFVQEYRAERAIASLLDVIQPTSVALRDRVESRLAVNQIVPGDIVLLSAGMTIPGDGIVIESKDLFVDESALTGESYPSEKFVAEASAANDRSVQLLFHGTHVVSGAGKMLVVCVGQSTEFGKISERLKARLPETEFERGVRRFGEMLIRITLILVITIFAINVFFHRPVLESFMFSLALAVGITPELLPAIVTMVLAHGAQKMARSKVVVRRLAAIENFGSMDVLCTDKTGTLTEGKAKLHSTVNPMGESSDQVRLLAVLNARFESGFANPLDEELRAQDVATSEYVKWDEVPYDFVRKRLSVVVESCDSRNKHIMITKGATENVLKVCSQARLGKDCQPIESCYLSIHEQFENYCREGYRVLGVATRDVTGDPVITKDDETSMTFEGFLLFHDPPKVGAADTVEELLHLGVQFKLITGDNRFVAESLCSRLGLPHKRMLVGDALRHMSDEALMQRVGKIDVFAETEPNQKERILLALRKSGHVVGFLGDGINDASALHAADVGISVDSAVDVAKAAADIVLLRHDLSILVQGVRDGRKAFANTLKYIFITTSANFGNMASMAVASLFLPFLPLIPKQILLNNFLSDLPALTIATDAVDPEQIVVPRRWDDALIQRSMLSFGLVSSVFDLLTFGVLLVVLKATETQFQTGWFVESVLTELLIALVIRTNRSVLSSFPSPHFVFVSVLVSVVTLLLPYSPLANTFGLVPLPLSFLFSILMITTGYLIASEWTKRWMFSRMTQPQVSKTERFWYHRHSGFTRS